MYGPLQYVLPRQDPRKPIQVICFSSVRLCTLLLRFLGCAVPDPAGATRYFWFKVLIYGLRTAVHCVTKLTKPLLSYLNSRGTRVALMIDDIRILGRTPEETQKAKQLVIHAFQSAGWNFQWKKCTKLPSQLMLYQGLLTSTRDMAYLVPSWKIADILHQ